MTDTPGYVADLRQTALQGWNRFWFTPVDPATLGLIRFLTGAMLLYTHAIWSLDLEGFLGADGQLPKDFSQTYHGSGFAWSYLYWIRSASVLWIAHYVALGVLFLFTIGFQTRVTGVLSFVITVAYANRAAGSLYGLDQINGFLTLYLAVGPSGAAFSVDRLLARWRRGEGVSASIGANVSIRLIQLHMCVLYFVAGCAKLRSDEWWNGEAIWYVLANYEYQSVDLIWMGKYPLLIALLTHATVCFEVGYIALIWPKLTRPLYLFLAVGVHLTIGACIGMMTFGLIMIVANMAFLSPRLVRRLAGPFWPKASVEDPTRQDPEQ